MAIAISKTLPPAPMMACLRAPRPDTVYEPLSRPKSARASALIAGRAKMGAMSMATEAKVERRIVRTAGGCIVWNADARGLYREE